MLIALAFLAVAAAWMEWMRRAGPVEQSEADAERALTVSAKAKGKDEGGMLSPEYVERMKKERWLYRLRVAYTSGERKRIGGASKR